MEVRDWKQDVCVEVGRLIGTEGKQNIDRDTVINETE
jgi:hypothetical protein